jgi:hypothetical protein
MKSNLLILILAASLLLNYIQWKKSSPDSVVVVGKTLFLETPGGTETKPQPAREREKPIDSTEIRRILRVNDSLQSYITSLPAKQRDSAIVDLSAPFQIVVEDSVSTNFVTIDPLKPKGLRATTDSTRYKPLKLSIFYLDTTEIVNYGTSITGYLSATAGAIVGSTIAGPPGAGVGALVGLAVAELLKDD